MEKKKVSATSGQPDVKKEKSNNVKKEVAEKSGAINNKPAQNDGADNVEEVKTVDKKAQGEPATPKTTGTVKTVKKKIIKKVVKQKVANKTNGTANKQLDKSNEKDNADKMISNVPVQDEKSSVNLSGDNASAKTASTEDASVGKTDGVEVKDKKGTNNSDDKPQDKSDATVTTVNDSGVKTTKKKKIIKRVPKKKVTAGVSKAEVSDQQNEGNVVAPQVQADTQSTPKQTTDADNSVAEVNKSEKTVPKLKSKPATSGKQDKVVPNKAGTKSDVDDKKVDKASGEKSGAEIDKQKASEKDTHNGKGKLKDGDKSKDVKVTKERGGKDESKTKSSKEVKEKRKSDEPPRHSGFILQTKGSKESKVC